MILPKERPSLMKLLIFFKASSNAGLDFGYHFKGVNCSLTDNPHLWHIRPKSLKEYYNTKKIFCNSEILLPHAA